MNHILLQNKTQQTAHVAHKPPVIFPYYFFLLSKPALDRIHHCFHGLFFIFPVADKLDFISRFTHAPRTLNTLFAFAAVSSLYMNSTLHLYLLAMLQNIPAGLRCSPVGFVIATFCLIIMYSPHFCLLFALVVLIVFICLCLTAVLAFPCVLLLCLSFQA